MKDPSRRRSWRQAVFHRRSRSLRVRCLSFGREWIGRLTIVLFGDGLNRDRLKRPRREPALRGREAVEDEYA